MKKQFRDDGTRFRLGSTIILSVLALLVAGASAYAMFLTGDSGARSVWEGEVTAATAAPAPSATPPAGHTPARDSRTTRS